MIIVTIENIIVNDSKATNNNFANFILFYSPFLFWVKEKPQSSVEPYGCLWKTLHKVARLFRAVLPIYYNTFPEMAVYMPMPNVRNEALSNAL